MKGLDQGEGSLAVGAGMTPGSSALSPYSYCDPLV